MLVVRAPGNSTSLIVTLNALSIPHSYKELLKEKLTLLSKSYENLNITGESIAQTLTSVRKLRTFDLERKHNGK